MDERASRKKKTAGAPAAGWEITFCALVLILVAFFAMLVSYSSIEDEKVTNFMFGFGGDAIRLRDASLSPDISGYMPTPGETIHIPSKEVLAVDNQSVLLSFRKLETVARMMALEAETVAIERTERGFKAVLKGDVLFSSGTADITTAMIPYLDELIGILRDNDYTVSIEGHTDNVPISTARFPSNWELSTARAVSIIKYFLQSGNIEAERLEAVGYSEFRPVADNDSVEGRAKNRRVECYFEMAPEGSGRTAG